MNKQDIIAIAKTLGENTAPQLRTYIYIEWAGWLIFFVVALATMAAIWKYRGKINERMDGFPAAEIALAVGVLIVGLLGMAFVPYTLHVLTTPELEALKSLLGSLS